MQVLWKWLQLHRETLRRLPWLRPVLLIFDVILIAVGVEVEVSAISGWALGFLGIIINELLSPIIARQIFIKELHAQAQGVASMELKVIRQQNNNA